MSLLFRLSLGMFAAAVLAACSSVPTSGGGPAADAPTYHVGDRWVYQLQDGFFRTVMHWEETHEVTSITADGITVRVTAKGDITGERTELWAAPGVVKVGTLVDIEIRRFTPVPLKEYDFPLAPGKVWNQRINQINETTKHEGEINRYVRVGGWQQTTTPAGSFDTLQMQISMWLDDETFWRYPTNCTYQSFYAPTTRSMVHEEKECQYIEKGLDNSGFPIRTQHALVDLVSFTPGKP